MNANNINMSAYLFISVDFLNYICTDLFTILKMKVLQAAKNKDTVMVSNLVLCSINLKTIRKLDCQCEDTKLCSLQV